MAGFPRVTAILAAVGLGPDLSHIPAPVLEAARARGSAVHALIEAEAYGYLADEEVPADLAPYLDAYRKFVAESGHEAIGTEIRVAHPAWRYQGHVDRVGWLLGKRVILDFKTGTAEGADYQVAAYVEAWNASHPDRPVAAGGIVLLRDDASYRLVDVDLAAATQVWLAALVVYRAQPQRIRALEEAL